MSEYKDPYKPAEHLELNKIEDESPKAFKKIHCPSCGEDVESNNLSLEKTTAKCSGCNVIFSIEDDISSLTQKDKVEQQVFRPEGIELFKFKNALDITVQQHIRGLDAFGIIFLPLLAFLSYFIYFERDIPIYGPVLLTIGAIYFIYKAINYPKYKTYIDVNENYLQIKYRPKNLIKDKSYDVKNIDQLYLKYDVNGTGYISVYMIINSTEGQSHQKLITVKTLAKAKYLEQEIEKYLNIKNRKVDESNV